MFFPLMRLWTNSFAYVLELAAILIYVVLRVGKKSYIP